MPRAKRAGRRRDISPALLVGAADRRAFALIVQDPDAPTPGRSSTRWRSTFPAAATGSSKAHWRAPAATRASRSAAARSAASAGRARARSPATGRALLLVFQLVALARPLGLGANAGLADALAAMAGATLARGRLTGFYERR